MIAPIVRGTLVALLFVLSSASAQQRVGSVPHAVTNVAVAGEESGRKVTLVLRSGRIESVQPADAELPPGLRLVDGEGLVASPAFLDAYSRHGLETPEPEKDQDVPVDERADVRPGMRQANRKGIQPAFHSVDALAVDGDVAEGWCGAGFGSALVAPGGQLLAGTRALAATREAAPRDLIVRPRVFAHAAFAATGPGYPSTLMGYLAQLRQFLMDAQRHATLQERHTAGRPGERPPWDAELDAAGEILSGERRLVGHAQTSRDAERWLELADEFGLSVGISGGRDAWRVAEELASRGVPVFLTLEWGEEVEDPDSDEEADEESPDAEGETEAEGESEDAGDASAEEADEDGEDAEADEEAEDEERWIYTEPLEVRRERRRLWEERRDCALRLHEAGVRFAFGTAGESPGDLLENVRALVEAGLPVDVARTALTSEAAALLGVGERLGKLEPGYDATFALWTADPLEDEDAKVAWIFVDGRPREFDVEPGLSGEPDEGVDLTGTWEMTVETDEDDRDVTLVLEMDESGAVQGTLTTENPMDESDLVGDVKGHVAGKQAELETTLSMGGTEIGVRIKGALDGDSWEGKYVIRFGENEMVRPFEATRSPERSGGRS